MTILQAERLAYEKDMEVTRMEVLKTSGSFIWLRLGKVEKVIIEAGEKGQSQMITGLWAKVVFRDFLSTRALLPS